MREKHDFPSYEKFLDHFARTWDHEGPAVYDEFIAKGRDNDPEIIQERNEIARRAAKFRMEDRKANSRWVRDPWGLKKVGLVALAILIMVAGSAFMVLIYMHMPSGRYPVLILMVPGIPFFYVAWRLLIASGMKVRFW